MLIKKKKNKKTAKQNRTCVKNTSTSKSNDNRTQYTFIQIIKTIGSDIKTCNIISITHLYQYNIN